MKKIVSVVLVVSMFGMVTMPGCETMGGSAGTGAALGGIAGGIIGHQSGRGIEGALVGALVGAVAGAIVHDVRERRVRDAQQTYQHYDYQPSEGLRLNIEGSKVDPPRVQQGGNIDGSFDYAVMGAGSGVVVREQFVLMKGDEVLGEVYGDNVTRPDGTYQKGVIVSVPEDAEGTYRLANVVTAQNMTRTNFTDFEVMPKSAGAEPGAARGEFKIAIVSNP